MVEHFWPPCFLLHYQIWLGQIAYLSLFTVFWTNSKQLAIITEFSSKFLNIHNFYFSYFFLSKYCWLMWNNLSSVINIYFFDRKDCRSYNGSDSSVPNPGLTARVPRHRSYYGPSGSILTIWIHTMHTKFWKVNIE